MTEVETFLQALAGRIGELESQVARADSTGSGAREKLFADAERLARIADVELAAGGRASFDSRITLDALQDAQADIVARVESTAKDLHDSIERDGRVTSPRTNWRSSPTSVPPTSVSPTSVSPTAPAAAPPPRETEAQPTESASEAAPIAAPEPAAQAEPAPATAPTSALAADTPPQEPAVQTEAAVAASRPSTSADPVAVPSPAPAPKPEVDLAGAFAQLDEDPLGDATSALDDVLDDVMGTIRPRD